MKFPRKTVLSLVGVIVCLNVLYRYPATFSHAVGFDSFLLYNMADSISFHGYAKWVINPLSYFGMYAFSYPSGMPFVYSLTSQMTGSCIETSILIAGILFGTVGALFTFLAAREIKPNDLIAFASALVYSSAPFLVNITSWEGSGKGYVVALLPFFVFCLVKHLKTANIKFLIVAPLTLMVMATIHRIGYIALFIFFAYLFTMPIHNITKLVISPDIKRLKTKRIVSALGVILLFAFTFSLLYVSPGFLGSPDVTEQFEESAFFRGTDPFTTLLNMGVSYTGKIGIVFPVMFAGIIGLALQKRREMTEKFLILSVVFLIPFLPMREYMTAFFISVFSLLIGYSIYYIYTALRRRKRIAIAVAAAIMLMSVGFCMEMKGYWRDNYYYNVMSDDSYMTGIYLKHTLSRNDMFIANKGYVSLRVTAVSGVVSLPLGGASGASYNPQQLIYDDNFDLNMKELDIRVTPLEEVGYATNEIFTFNDPGRVYDAEFAWATVLDKPADGTYSYSGSIIRDRFGINYALETHDLDGRYVFWREYWSPFLGTDITPDSVHYTRYKIYDCAEEAIWFV